MARGFESKSVADQQESAREARRRRKDEKDEAEPARVLRRRRLELARADILHRMEVVEAEPHREMLQRALTALEKELARLA
jgi:hypothetical protein